MSTSTQTRDKAAGALMRELSPASRNYKAWVTKAAKQPMVLETLDPGPLRGAPDRCPECRIGVAG